MRTAFLSTGCQNCDSPLEGGYCAQCGQSRATLDLPVGNFAKEFVSEAFSLDSRLRNTLRPLFLSPGSVPHAFVAGQRARFVPPVRLYLFASFTMFLLLSFGSGPTVSNVTVSDDSSVRDSLSLRDSLAAELEPGFGGSPDSGSNSWADRLESRVTEGLERVDEDPQAFSGEILNRLAQSMFFLLPAFALLLKVVYRRRLYVHHFVYSVYLHSFAFLVVAFVAIPDAVGLTTAGRFMSIAMLTIPPYSFLAMKRFYGESWPKTVAKFAFVSLGYMLLGMATTGAVLLLSILSA